MLIFLISLDVSAALVRSVTKHQTQLSQNECSSVTGLHKALLRFCKNICSKLTRVQLFLTVFVPCAFQLPFPSSGYCEGNEWQSWNLICIKSIRSPFPSPAVILSLLHSARKTESKERSEGYVQEQFLLSLVRVLFAILITVRVMQTLQAEC